MRWNVDTQVRVAPFTRTFAELNIDEEEYDGDFVVVLRFYGRVTATIATRQSPNTYLKLIDGDIVEIIREAMENDCELNGLQIIEETLPAIQYTMCGKCSFRYGIQQHVLLNQELLKQTSSPILHENPTSLFGSRYRPLRTQLISINKTNDLKISDDEHYEILSN